MTPPTHPAQEKPTRARIATLLITITCAPQVCSMRLARQRRGSNQMASPAPSHIIPATRGVIGGGRAMGQPVLTSPGQAATTDATAAHALSPHLRHLPPGRSLAPPTKPRPGEGTTNWLTRWPRSATEPRPGWGCLRRADAHPGQRALKRHVNVVVAGNIAPQQRPLHML